MTARRRPRMRSAQTSARRRRGSRRDRCRGSGRARRRRLARPAQDLSGQHAERVGRGDSRAASSPKAAGRGQARRARDVARRPADTPAGTRSPCSRRSRARRTPRRHRDPSTSRRRRRASARAELAQPRALARAHAPRGRHRSVARDQGPSSACAGRGGRAPAASCARDEPERPRPRRAPDRAAGAGRRPESARPRAPAARAKRAHTRSSSGRSTWQETTAYRSRPAMGRILTSWRGAAALVAAAAVLPRLAVLAHERGDILASFTEKSDDFAQVLVVERDVRVRARASPPPTHSRSTAGSSPGSTGRSLASGSSSGWRRSLVAAATALVVLWAGRRFLSPPRRARSPRCLDSASVPDLARRPRQPGDPRPAPRRRRLRPHAARRREGDALARQPRSGSCSGWRCSATRA